MAETDGPDITGLTVQLLSAYLANNTVPPTELAELIRSTRVVLGESPAEATPEVPENVYAPAVSVRKSLASPEHIISLIDGKPYKTLKRHLAKHGLTPASYRERYGLPSSYPVVAPAFAEKRRGIAAAIGLGRKPKPEAVATPSAPAPGKAAATAAKEAPVKSAGKAKSAKRPVAAKGAAKQAGDSKVATTGAATGDVPSPSTEKSAPKKAKRMARVPSVEPVASALALAETAAAKRVRPAKSVSTPAAKTPKAKAAKAQGDTSEVGADAPAKKGTGTPRKARAPRVKAPAEA